MSVVTLIILCCVGFALWSWLKPSRLRIPSIYPGALPIIGHGHLLIGDAQHMWNTEKMVYDYCLKEKEAIEMRLGSHSVYIISDPDDGLTVANKCLDKPYLYHFGKEMYGRGLVTANASIWKPHRRLLNPAFNQQVLHTFVEEFNNQAKSLVSQLASEVGKEPFDVQPYMINNLLGTACRTSLGLKTDKNSVIVKNYALATEELFVLYLERIQRVWLHFSINSAYRSPLLDVGLSQAAPQHPVHFSNIFNWSSYKKKQDSLMKIIKDITKAVITNRKSNLRSFDSLYRSKEAASANFKPLVDHMLDLADQQDAFTEEEIREHLDTIIAAAYDTTATALTFILILTGSHQDVQERIHKELLEVLGDQGRDLNRHDLPKLVYMEAVIKESLRLYPPVPRVARTSATDVQLKNCVLPANCTYVISLYGLNRHSSWGADAEQFKPERWLDTATLPEKPNTFASFSLGKLYGMMAVKTTLAYILRRYRVKSDIENLVTRCDLLLKPVLGHQISVELRN